MKNAVILIIDDSEDIHILLKAHLKRGVAKLHHAYTAREGLHLARTEKVDLILLDIGLPDMDGFATCRVLKGSPELVNIPVIFLTGKDDVKAKITGFSLGAVDYITKPFEPEETRARISSAIRTKKYLDLLSERAQLDGLTGLWNRRYCEQRLRAEVKSSERYGRDLSVLMIDIDHFKSINDTYGHPFGDEVLQEFAHLLTTSTRESDVACRYGGEEFIVLLTDTNLAAAQIVAKKLHQAVHNLAICHKRQVVPITCSIGVSSTEQFKLNGGRYNENSLVVMADDALYEAKNTGRDKIVVSSTCPAPQPARAPSLVPSFFPPTTHTSSQ